MLDNTSIRKANEIWMQLSFLVYLPWTLDEPLLIGVAV